LFVSVLIYQTIGRRKKYDTCRKYLKAFSFTNRFSLLISNGLANLLKVAMVGGLFDKEQVIINKRTGQYGNFLLLSLRTKSL